MAGCLPPGGKLIEFGEGAVFRYPESVNEACRLVGVCQLTDGVEVLLVRRKHNKGRIDGFRYRLCSGDCSGARIYTYPVNTFSFTVHMAFGAGVCSHVSGG